MLARFYLGQVNEQTGRHDRAIETYTSFLKHFEHVSARLPQIAAARDVLGQFQFSERGSLLFNEDFSGDTLGPNWEEAAGRWNVANGVATVSERSEDYGQAACRRILAFHDAILEFSFRMDGAQQIAVSLYDRSGSVGRLAVRPQTIALDLDSKRDSPARFERLGIPVEPGKWHKAVFEIRGKHMIAQLDDKYMVMRDSARVDVDKAGIKLLVTGSSASFDYLRVYNIRSGKRFSRVPHFREAVIAAR
jgi:hypothetical protein